MATFAFVVNGAVTATSPVGILDEVERVYGAQYSQELFGPNYTDAEREAVGTFEQIETAPAPDYDQDFEYLTASQPVWNAGAGQVQFNWIVIERDLEQSRDIVLRLIRDQWLFIRDQGVNGLAPPVDVRVWMSNDTAVAQLLENEASYRRGVKGPTDRAICFTLLSPDEPFIDRVADNAAFLNVLDAVLQMHDAADDRAFELGKDAKQAADRAALTAVRDAIPTGWPAGPTYS